MNFRRSFSFNVVGDLRLLQCVFCLNFSRIPSFPELPIRFNSPPFVFCLHHLLFSCTHPDVASVVGPFLVNHAEDFGAEDQIATLLQFRRPSSSPDLIIKLGLALKTIYDFCAGWFW